MHREFANIYDVFMESVDYENWYMYLRKYIKNPGTVLDLGCGTGEFLVKFLKDGFTCIGVDISEVMLEIARDKTKESPDIELYQGDIRKFRTEKPAEYIVCNFDTVNYFDKFNDLEDFLDCSYENLTEIFDEMFENGVFLDEKENYLTIWRYDKEGENYIINIKLFIREKENLFRNYEEVHVKTIFDLEEIANKALETGFDIVDIRNDEEFGEKKDRKH